MRRWMLRFILVTAAATLLASPAHAYWSEFLWKEQRPQGAEPEPAPPKPFLLGARHRLPGCLVASQGAAFEEGGVRLVGQTLSTRVARFFENDFVVDLVFALPADRGIVCIDFGGGGRKYPLRLRIHSAGFAPSGVDLSKNERG